MTTIAGFISRAEAGLRKPDSFSSRITPDRGGVALHYGGPPAHIDSHDDCVRTWRGWQGFHMGPQRRWADIAYTMGVCNHGYVLAGRGAGRRTAANGTNYGNQNFYAVVWLGGEGQVPTQEAQDAIAWAVNELRTNGGAGNRVRSHSDFKGTGCPGDHLRHLASSLDDRPVAPPESPSPGLPPYPGLTREGMRNSAATRAYQQRLKDRGWRVGVDGDHGPQTTAVLKAFQKEKRLGVDGVGGPNTWAALWSAPIT